MQISREYETYLERKRDAAKKYEASTLSWNLDT